MLPTMARSTKRKRGPRAVRPTDDPARGDRIKDAIKQRHMAQAAVAKALGVAVSTVARWCSGAQDPTKQVKALADLLGVSEAYLMYGAELSPAFREFEAWLATSPAGELAPVHVLKSLRGMPLHKPTLGLYQRLFFVLLAEYTD